MNSYKALMNIIMIDWHDKFLILANHISTWSKDPKTKVGAVIVDKDHRIISTGYNGFPRGVYDDPDLLIDREQKLKRIIHAEANAIINARSDLHGTSIYCSLNPCSQCAGFIIQSGISRVYIPSLDLTNWSLWEKDFEIARTMFKQASVSFESIRINRL